MSASIDTRELPKGELPVFTRKATGLVREVSLFDQTIFSASCTNPLGVGLVFLLFIPLYFPGANIYIATGAALAMGVFVWVAFALMSAAIPRIGGDYTINSRVLHPWLALGGNIAIIAGCEIAAGLVAYWVATQALSPALTVVGAVTGSATITKWGTYFSTDHRVIVFVTAIVALAVVAALSIKGTRVLIRTLTIMFIVAFVGLVVSMIILLTTSHSSFVSTIDHFAGAGSYHKTVAAGAGSGLYPTHGYSAHNTIGAIFTALGVTVYTFMGMYLAPEFKGAGQRRRQLVSIVGSGLVQGLLLMLCVFIFLRTVGYDFFVSALAGNFSGAGSGSVGTAGYAYFSSIVSGSSVVTVILAIAFLGWWLPDLNINVVAAVRSMLAWSFDGLFPTKASEVNDRTHTPVIAIAICFTIAVGTAAWVSFSPGFFGVFSIMLLTGFPPIVLVGISAMLLKRRRPDLYYGSPAEWRIGSVEVLPIAGFFCALVGVAGIVLAVLYPTQLGISSALLAGLVPVFALIAAAVWYWGAKYIRARQGLDLSLAYRQIPPD